jgi:predicted nucleic acid-binding protein
VPLIGVALLTEFEDLIAQAAQFERSTLVPAARNKLLDSFFACCEWTRVYFGWRPNLPDEGDSHLVALAMAGGAGFVVSLNQQSLRRTGLEFSPLKVMGPGRFLEEIAL